MKKNNLNRTLEIGLACGLSALFICQAHKDKNSGQHIAIDPYQSHYNSAGLLNIKKAGFENFFQFHASPSFKALPRLYFENLRLDFAFIDGSHLFDYILLDFFYIDKLLEVNKFIIFDDLWMPAVRKVIGYILRNRSYKIIEPFPLEDKTKFYPLKKLARIGWRFLQNPFEGNFRVKFITESMGFLQKIDEDKRGWDFHRTF